MSVYSEIKALGIPIDNHKSDLYCLATEEARQIAKKYQRSGVNSFVSQIDGKLWLDIPFAYEPFWEAKQVNYEHDKRTE